MFRKFVSNLPFSPSLVGQLGFYAKRLKKEQFTRQLGLVCIVLAVLVQLVSFISPARPTLAASGNDIVYGGAGKSAAGIVAAYRNNKDALGRRDIKAIFNAYGINDQNVGNYRIERIYSRPSNNYWSIGRSPRGYGGEVPKPIPGGPTVYSRTLHGWQANTWWSAMRYDTPQGPRWVLIECGNIVTQNTPPVQPPDVTISKSVSKQRVKTGERIMYTLNVKNIGKGTAKNVLVYDNSPAGVNLLNDGLGSDPLISTQRWQTSRRFNMAPNQSFTYRIYARITAKGPAVLTNKACVDIFDTNIFNNCDQTTVVVPQPCPYNPALPIDSPDCKSHPDLKIEKTTPESDLKVGETFIYTLKVTNTGDINLPRVTVRDVAPEEIEFLAVKTPGSTSFTPLPNRRDFTSATFALQKKQSVIFQLRSRVIRGSEEPIINQACVISLGTSTIAGACDDEDITVEEPCPTNSSLPINDPQCQPPCPIPGQQHLPANSPECRPCDDDNQNNSDLSCLELHKRARNTTQDIDNANGSRAEPGDMIEYTLSVRNRSKLIRKAFVIEENMDDVLEYADIIDASGATFQREPVRMLTWQPVDINPGQTVSRTILVKIKSVIPKTPASTSDPRSFDLRLVNVYGDTVRIELPPQPVKTVERTIKVLPNTGLGANVLLSTATIMIATYFYFRSRLMVKEIGLVRQEFSTGGTL